MGLVKITTRDKTRALLNEITEGFWLNSQLDGWIDDAAIDISTLTFCYEQSTPITLLTSTQLYTVHADCLKVLGAIYANVGLKSATPWMEGVQTAVTTGAPKYFFEIIQKLGVFPIPTVTENNTVLTVYYAKVTNNIQNNITKNIKRKL